MNATHRYTARAAPLPLWVFGGLLPGAAAALAGGYWDDAWHTERGRDSFFIAPHLAIYGGISLVGAILVVWTAAVARRDGVRTVQGEPGLVLALLCAGVTLASAPIDNAWHLAFGRDAVLWSPPHMLGIVGMMGLAVAALVQLASSDSSGAGAMRAVAAGLVIAGANVTVIEYETDVPQFADVWFLPALVASTAVAVMLIRRADDHPLAATRGAVAHLGFMVAVAGFLLAEGFDAPLLPLVVAPVLALELVVGRTRRTWAGGLAFVAATFAVYGAARGLAVSDLAIGFPVALVAGLVIIGWRPSHAALAAIAGAAMALAFTGTALAHDPGQGHAAGAVDWHVTAARSQTVRGEVTLPGTHCGDVVADALVARRGGRAIRTPARRRGCLVLGRVRVDEPGRWFIYVDLHRDGRPIQTWVPVKVGTSRVTVDEAGRFAYEPRHASATWMKDGAGVVLYGAMLALLVAMARLAGRGRPAGARE